MPVSIARIRFWFALTALLVMAIVSGIYFVRRYEARIAGHYVAKKLGIDIQQTTEGFIVSHSEGGRTVYKISAKKATQYKDSGKATLQDVNIIVYGRDASRFDQIYGANFEYDTKSGNVVAHGEVDIDLEANTEGPKRPDQATPTELKNPIHLKTSNLVFNQKTGQAHTDDPIEFHVPQANGTARGVDYDSHTNQLTLLRDVHILTIGTVSRTLVARHAVVTKEPRRAVLSSVTLTQPDSTITSDVVTVYFRSDNTVSQILGDGHIEADNNGANSYQVTAAKGNLEFGNANDLKLVTLSDGTQFRSSGERPMHGFSNRMITHFGANTQAQSVRLEENAHVIQDPAASGPAREQQRTEVVADALNINLRDGKTPSKATTEGAAHVNLDQAPSKDQPATATVVNAGRFFADFSPEGHINHILGVPNVKVVSIAQNQPDKVSTSDKLEVFYNPQGEVSNVVQQGHFTYAEMLPKEGDRTATADQAHYTPLDDLLHLTGSPRVVDGGMAMTASAVSINRRTGEAVGDGDVKTTYSDLKPQPNGAMLASSDPIHVTAKHMVAHRSSGIALYTGGSRLWQAANIVQAPTIEFDRDNRSLIAQGSANQSGFPVTSVFVQKDKTGKLSPVNIASHKLTYVDSERRARYDGGIVAHSTDGTLTASSADIYLKQSGAATNVAQPTPSQLDRIVCTGNVVISQPGRRGSGDQLTYFGDEAKYVLTGGNPQIYDAEHGTVRGATLTFFSNDDRVLVEGSKAAPTVTHTRVSK
ncbi:MAG TPA: LPS export ABC transporter periplasmic protein LptC [Candidatus Koribacter sp.]|jgi:lipopolysaccharide export system protein LptA